MPFKAVVKWAFPIGAGHGVNTWHLRRGTGDVSDDTLEAALGHLREFYEDISASFPAGTIWSYDGTLTEVGTEDPELIATITPWTTGGGASGGAYGPAPCMACVSWHSSRATRSGRGRTFLGPLNRDAFENNGTLRGEDYDRILGAAASLIDTFDTGAETSGAFGVWSVREQLLRDFVTATMTDQAAVLTGRRS